MFFDPLYMLLLMIPMGLSFWASRRVQRAFAEYSKVGTASHFSGAEAAYYMLEKAGVRGVEIVPVAGQLSDHYDPQTRRLALSEDVFSSRSLAAVGVATHEAGHAIQHATGYPFLGIRSALVPTAGIGSNIGYALMAMGLVLSSFKMVILGAILFGFVVAFQIVTLPVEYDASRRAKAWVTKLGLVSASEKQGIDAVLDAAALTYVAAAVTSLVTLLYFLVRIWLQTAPREE